MREAARLGLPVAVHAESEEMTRTLASAAGSTATDFLASRPVEAELDAIARAVDLAGETGAKLHIVHVSTGSGVAKAAEGRARGVDVSVETCPHYLFFTEDDLDTIGVAVKCAPPLRHPDEHAMLWGEVLDGRVDLIASDHSPCRSVAEDRRRLPRVVGRHRGRAVDAGRAARAGARRAPPPVRAHRGVDRGKPGGAVPHPLERHASGRERRRSDAARSVAFVYAGRARNCSSGIK